MYLLLRITNGAFRSWNLLSLLTSNFDPLTLNWYRGIELL